jgi:hypothetical protein
MSDFSPTAAGHPELGAFRRESRINREEHWPIILVLIGLGILALAGAVWIVVRPVPWDVGRVACVLFLAGLVVAVAFGVRHYWLRLQRRIGLHENGLMYDDGRQTHGIPWEDVAEIYEAVSAVKVLGLTLGTPKPEATVVSTAGVRCKVDKEIRDAAELVPVVSEAVNTCLRRRAAQELELRRGLRFGILTVSERGLVIEKPPRQSFVEAFRKYLETDVEGADADPGEYGWSEVQSFRIATTRDNDTTYNQIQIRVNGRKSAVYLCGVPEFPNFAVFTEVLESLGQRLEAAR